MFRVTWTFYHNFTPAFTQTNLLRFSQKTYNPRILISASGHVILRGGYSFTNFQERTHSIRTCQAAYSWLMAITLSVEIVRLCYPHLAQGKLHGRRPTGIAICCSTVEAEYVYRCPARYFFLPIAGGIQSTANRPAGLCFTGSDKRSFIFVYVQWCRNLQHN